MCDTEQIDRLGVAIAQQHVLCAGHIFREQPVSDSGVDAHIEIKEGGKATGRLIAAQIKAGKSYFRRGNEEGFWHEVSDRHRNLWINHSLPVVVILCDTNKSVAYYENVTNETCVRAGRNWKIFVPNNKILNAASKLELSSIASPIVAASDYTLRSEQDVSHEDARRIRLDIVVHPGSKPLNKPLLGAIARAALKQGQSSQYYRDKITEFALRNRAVDVVFGFVYLRDIDCGTASWACRFQWISPDLDARSAPIKLEGEQDGSGLVIDWNANPEISKYIDSKRASKSEYLYKADRLIRQIPVFRIEIDKLLGGENSPGFSDRAENFEKEWDDDSSPPIECQRLDQAIQELLATVGNAGFIWDQRVSREQMQVRSFLQKYREDLDRLDGEISFLRRDVR
jgi:hypothetical protein